MGPRWIALRNYTLGVFIVALTTALLWMLRGRFEPGSLGLFYLLAIACVAAAGGTGPALLAAVLSFLTLDYFFIPPIFSLSMNDPQNWILLFCFLGIGILVGQIASVMRRREEEAEAREKDAAALYKAILALNAQTSLEPLVRQAMASAGAAGCAILLVDEAGNPSEEIKFGNVAGAVDEAGLRIARWSLEKAKAVGLPYPQGRIEGEETLWPVSVPHREALADAGVRTDVFIPLNSRARTFGLMYAAPAASAPFRQPECRLLVAFANTALAFLERRLLLEESAKLAAARENEQLRSVLFSSLSHNLKTPLASLTATLGSLRKEGAQWEESSLRESLGFMSEDVEQLAENISNLLNLAQLESGSWKPNQDWVELMEIVSIALRRFPENEYRRIAVSVPDDLPMLRVDSVQMSQVMSHLVENALSYSPPGSRVEIAATAAAGAVEFYVDDAGPGIPQQEREKVFVKFYRGASAAQRSSRGTGLGLAICREIVQAHGGAITVRDAPSGGARLLVSVPLPRAGGGNKGGTNERTAIGSNSDR